MSRSSTFALELVIRVSLLLALGALTAALLRRSSASLRHLVWSLSLGGSLVLALLVPLAPRVELRMSGWSDARMPDVIRRRLPVLDGKLAPPVLPDSSRVGVAGGPPDDVPRSEGASTRIAGNAPDWLTLWLAGAGVVLLWGLVGRLGLARLVRRSRPVSDDLWHEIVAETSVALGVRRPVRLYISESVGAPMTWGIRRPILLLPEESTVWDEDLRRSVAAHELAHVARYDFAMQLLAMVACACYWFHPLVWMSAKRMRQTAERACDDQVIALGIGQEDYAAHLIGVARGSRHLRLTGAVAIGMARGSTLEGRVLAILDQAIPRVPLSRRGRRAGVAATIVALVLIAGATPVSGSTLPKAAPADERVAESGGLRPEEPKPEQVESRAPRRAPLTVPLTAPLPASVHRSASQDSTWERTLSAAPGELLDLDLDAGGEVRVQGWDEPRVSVRARLGGLHWRDVEVDVERVSNGVRVASRFVGRRALQSSDNHFEVRVPRRYDVRISSSGGTLTLVGLEGEFRGHTGGGGFVLQRLKGMARLTTGGGEIHVWDSELAGRVQTGGGMVRLSRVSGGLRGSSGSGAVIYGERGQMLERDMLLPRSMRLPDEPRGVRDGGTTDLTGIAIADGGSSISIGSGRSYGAGILNIQKAGGSVDLEAAPAGARIRTGGGPITVGRAAGLVSAITGGGDIRLGPVAGSVTAGTGSGNVRIIVDNAPGEDQTVEVSSGRGRVIVELPADFDGRLDLQTAHTRTFEGTARIISDWELELEPLTDWDDREGTPRRYLRASAVLGRGRGRVIVTTVNGEIEIRRR